MTAYSCGWCDWRGADPEAAREHLVVEHAGPAEWLQLRLGQDPGALLGSPVWYWLQDQSGDGWQAATVTGLGGKDGAPVYDVALEAGGVRWGWPWQVLPRAEDKPGPSGKPQELWRAADVAEVVHTARRLLHQVDHITTNDFRRGGERLEREQLREALARLLGLDPGEVTR
jgi:hypothetical protein